MLKSILNKISNPVASESVMNIQVNILNSLLSGARLNRLVTSANRFGDKNTYAIEIMMEDVKAGVWSELVTKKPIDGYRRNLQKAYIDALGTLVNQAAGQPSNGNPFMPNTRNTDVVSVARAQLVALRAQVTAAIPGTSDKMSKYHLQDVAERIKKALDPKG